MEDNCQNFFFNKASKLFFLMKIQRKNKQNSDFDKKNQKKLSRLHTKNFNR